MGVRDDARKCLNLEGSLWFDTYTEIIRMFRLYCPKYNDNAEACTFLNRDCLKSVIMIINYNAKIPECVHTLVSYLYRESMFISGFKYGEFMRDFYDFVAVRLFDILYCTSINTYKKKHTLQRPLQDAIIDLRYFETDVKKTEVRIDEHRWVLSETVTTDVIDAEGTEVSLNANDVQALDAEHMRFIRINVDAWCVHDSFGVSIVDIGLLMDTSNKYFNLKQGTKNYSIFILI